MIYRSDIFQMVFVIKSDVFCSRNKFSINYRKFSNSKPFNVKIQGSFHQITIKSWPGMIEYALFINTILVLSGIFLFIGNAKEGPCEL